MLNTNLLTMMLVLYPKEYLAKNIYILSKRIKNVGASCQIDEQHYVLFVNRMMKSQCHQYD